MPTSIRPPVGVNLIAFETRLSNICAYCVAIGDNDQILRITVKCQ